MSPDHTQVSPAVLALRREFDLSFAKAAQTQTDTPENLLALRIEGEPYAIRLTEISGLYADRRIMPLPSPVPELLGVTGFRGQIAPVYDLAALLGYRRAVSARWLILLRSPLRTPINELLCLAFDCFEMHFSVAQQIALTPGDIAQPDATPRPHLFAAVRSNEVLRPIIQISSLLQDIQRRADPYIPKGRDQT